MIKFAKRYGMYRKIKLLEQNKGTLFLFLAYSGLVYAAGRKQNEKNTH